MLIPNMTIEIWILQVFEKKIEISASSLIDIHVEST